jgi:uncharacterized membrane protein HdeD (DUF308 family)
MRRNMSDSERWVRSVLGALAVFFGVLSLSATGWSTVAWFVGGALLLTGVAGYCPIYDLFGYSTVETGENDPNRW